MRLNISPWLLPTGRLIMPILRLWHWLKSCRLCWGRVPRDLNSPALVLLAFQPNTLNCGLAGIISFQQPQSDPVSLDLAKLERMVQTVETQGKAQNVEASQRFSERYLGGSKHLADLLDQARALKRASAFIQLFQDERRLAALNRLSQRLQGVINVEQRILDEHMGSMLAAEVDAMILALDTLKDINWCLTAELCANIDQVRELIQRQPEAITPGAVVTFRKINAVLNSIDRLEVRGRDSAGLSLMFILKQEDYEHFRQSLQRQGQVDGLDYSERFDVRERQDVLLNQGIRVRAFTDEQQQPLRAVTLTYKTAAEIGSLGDNVQFLRAQILKDQVLQLIATYNHRYHTISAHTRWASVGAINEPNCHPVDNMYAGHQMEGTIQVCLNGDIDNYLALKAEFERSGSVIPKEITTDTKIIPLRIEHYFKQGYEMAEAFRRAVNDFEGSHAICMHTDLAPGKLFLAQRGSGQAIFVGLAPEHYVPTSEVYGFVEETPHFVKLDGEKTIIGPYGPVHGQIFILDQESSGGLEGIRAIYYDGTPVALTQDMIKHTAITSRDIDRQGFPHYFLKEISEAPVSVEQTLRNRWKIIDEGQKHYAIQLDESVFPDEVRKAVVDGQVKRVFFVGQGTAGVASLACAEILNYYLNDPTLNVNALKASELSGFKLDGLKSMQDTLVVAISQSGTTTDTNRAVDMARERGAYTLAIVNRRDSDISFKVNGVLYTSSGRDIEMSVASTKAFYAQIVAGALLGLYVARLKGHRNEEFVADELRQLLSLPQHMRQILGMQEAIKASAQRLAVSKTYWAAVGSGPNKASADEIRIKLSELCYKTISSDYIEDKKHIDLSSEPLIIVCAAGTRNTVIGDVIKDTAIFKAHKAAPVVIADAGEDRFEPYAEDVFHVPVVSEHLAPIVNTLLGHLWGYYAALAINEGSRFLYHCREEVQQTLQRHTNQGLNIYEVMLEKSFREKMVGIENQFRTKKATKRFSAILGVEAAADLSLLFKYLSGKLPVTDFELDFGLKGTPLNMINTLIHCLGNAINSMSRPVDAIKHQAKTVTVGTSRISEKLEGILFDTLAEHRLNVAQLTPNNILVIKNLQGIIEHINGAILYRIDGLNLLGEPTEDTSIAIVHKAGVLKALPSRVETDRRLQGTKRIIVNRGNVYIGKGRKDGRSILVLPIISDSPDRPNIIQYLLLLNIAFKQEVPLEVKIKALGGKYEHIKNIVTENSLPWHDHYLDQMPIEDLFGVSAEKIGEAMVARHH